MARRLVVLAGLFCVVSVGCRSAEHHVASPTPPEVDVVTTDDETGSESSESRRTIAAPHSDGTPDAPRCEIVNVGFDDESAENAASAGDDTEPGELPKPLFVEGEFAPLGLSLADFEAMALAHNPSLQVAGYGIGGRLGVRTQVGLRPNPEVGYSGQEMGSDGEAGQQGVYLSQTFVRGRKLQLNRAIAQWDTAEASWIAETQRFRVLNDVRTAFYEVLGAQRRIAIAEELVTVADKGVETSNALVEAQQAGRPDVLQAEVQRSEVGIALRNAEIAHDTAWNRLASLAGQPYIARAPLVGELHEELPVVEWEAAYGTLVSLSPELQRAEARIQRARVLIARQCAQPIPNVLTQFGVAHSFGNDSVVSSVQIGLPLPIHNRNQGNIRAAVAESHRAERDAERIRLSLRERLAATVRDFEQARQEAERYRDEIVPKSRESYELIESGYEQGEFDFLRVLTARRAYFESQLAYVNALVALNRAHVALEGLLLTGGLDPVPEPNDGSGLRDQALSGQ